MFFRTTFDNPVECPGRRGIVTLSGPTRPRRNITGINPNTTTKIETIIVVNRPLRNTTRLLLH